MVVVVVVLLLLLLVVPVGETLNLFFGIFTLLLNI